MHLLTQAYTEYEVGTVQIPIRFDQNIACSCFDFVSGHLAEALAVAENIGHW